MKVALDCETGGLDANLHPILGLAIWSPDLEETEVGPFKIGISADPAMCQQRALEVNGLDPREGVSPEAAAIALDRWWRELGSPRLQLVGHNVGSFDVPFVKRLAARGALPWDMMFDYHYRDTATLALLAADLGIISGKLNLKAVANAVGVYFRAHDATQDAMASWHVWERLAQAVSNRELCSGVFEEYANDGRFWCKPFGWEVIHLGA